ncbi:hypothetical protein LTR15_010398 [Elasticomyces elasticus]|nr:hypothetical protein LTR15_010398 [Elasticomyces elasticus]
MAQQVLHLPELLEQIIIQLPTKDLLFSQKVCGTWKAVVDTSPHIQEALFYTIDAKYSITPSVTNTHTSSGHPCSCTVCKSDRNKVRLNPLLITSPGKNGEVEGLKNLLSSVLPAQASCQRMLYGKPTKEIEIFFEPHRITDTNLDWLRSGTRASELLSVCYTMNMVGVDRTVTMKAMIRAGKTFGEIKQRYGEVEEDLRAEGFEIRDAGWGVTHVKTPGGGAGDE